MATFEEALSWVNQGISHIKYPKKPDDLYTPIQYILSTKGKKIRPVSTLLAYGMYRDDCPESVLHSALAWEIFHNFTLMHDDLMDKADMRRTQPTVHNVWNANTAILSGDAMLILAYQYISKVPDQYLRPVLELFSKTAAEICEGQQYDMEFEKRLDVSEDEYLKMIRLKTAVLLGACLKTGAILGGAGENDTKNIYDFGINVGIAFQIKDDLLDVYGDPAIFGKNIGGDILCNKKTYLLVNTLNRSEKDDYLNLLHWINSKDYDKNEKIKAVTGIYNNIGIKEIAEEKMNYFYQEALTSLSLINIGEEKKQSLSDLAQMLMQREI